MRDESSLYLNKEDSLNRSLLYKISLSWWLITYAHVNVEDVWSAYKLAKKNMQMWNMHDYIYQQSSSHSHI